MLAWQDMAVSDSMDSESDESEFEEDQELEGEQEESDEEESDDDSGDDESPSTRSSWMTRAGAPAIHAVPIGTGRTRLPPVLGRHPSVVYIATLQTGPVAQLVRAHA